MKFKWLLVVLVFTLTSCSAGSQSNQPLPTVVLDDGNTTQGSTTQTVGQTPVKISGGGVTASGIVTSAQEAQLSFSLAGSVKKVYVAEGDQVKAGDLLAELDNASIQWEVDQAQRTVREMTSPAAIAAAEQAVANAQKIYDDAKKKVDGIKNRHADNVTIQYLEDQVTLAQDALDRAREAYKQTARLSDVDPIRAKAGTNLYNAQKAYNRALSNLDWYANPPSPNDVALANADFDAASAALQEAQWYVSELKGESIPADATGAQLAQLQQARANLQAAQDKLERTRLRSSIAGAVTMVNVAAGEYVAPGQAIIAVSDVEHLQVITTDLSERDVPQISVGQSVKVLVEALNKEIAGHVLSISPVADKLGGDVVYKTTIALDELPEGVRAGMSVTVQYE
jgi:multidrug resistance efflux pump